MHTEHKPTKARLRIKNWEKFQHYQTGRNAQATPPWIKVHTKMIDDFDFMSMSAERRGQLILLWILASKDGGLIPNDARYLRKRLQCNVDLSFFLENGWVESYDDPRIILGSSYESPRPEEEEEEEEKKKKKTPLTPLGGEPADSPTETKTAAQRKDTAKTAARAAIVEAWNAIAAEHGLPMVQTLNEKRRRHMNARLDDAWFKTHWQEAMAIIPQSRFHIGVNERNWKATIDWFISEGKLQSFYELHRAKMDAPQPISDAKPEPMSTSEYYAREIAKQKAAIPT